MAHIGDAVSQVGRWGLVAALAEQTVHDEDGSGEDVGDE